MLFVDNMVIPIGGREPAGAEAWMNYVYDPANVGAVFESITLHLAGRRAPVELMSARRRWATARSSTRPPDVARLLRASMTLTPETRTTSLNPASPGHQR